MAKASALFERLQRSRHRVVAFRDLEKLLLAFGFVLERTRGSHRAFKHRNVPDVLTIQPKGKDAQPYQVRKFLDMIEQFHLELDE
jgi:predicted RNA binding protein YcfA (HicA-like mRNA interferase family)